MEENWLLSNNNLAETTGVPYPMTGSYFVEYWGRRQYEYLLRRLGVIGDAESVANGMVLVAGRVYLNISYIAENVAQVLPFDFKAIGVPPGLVHSEASPRLGTRLLLPFRLCGILCHTLVQWRRLRRFRQILKETFWSLRETYWWLRAAPRPADYQPSEQDWQRFAPLFDPAARAQVEALVNTYSFSTLASTAVSQLFEARLPALQALLSGHRNPTSQLVKDIWRLRDIAAQCGPEVLHTLEQGETDLGAYRKIDAAAPLVQAITAFLRQYGYRGYHFSSECEVARLADQPETVLMIIAGQLPLSPAIPAPEPDCPGLQTLQEMSQSRRILWKGLLRLGSLVIGVREQNRDLLELQNATYGLAARLLSLLLLPDQPPDHLWFYTFEEFLDFGESRGQNQVDRAVIARRHAELQRNRQQSDPPELLWYQPRTGHWTPAHEPDDGRDTPSLPAPPASPAPSALSLRGIGASPGCARGTAVVTNSMREAAERLLFNTGDVVLVTRVTQPAWSSMFRRLSGVVTELGGTLSHAALVAREQGIPAVVAVTDATKEILDGQTIAVDGDQGTVTVIDDGVR